MGECVFVWRECGSMRMSVRVNWLVSGECVSVPHIFVMIRSADVGAERSECFLMGAKCADMTTRSSVRGSAVQ